MARAQHHTDADHGLPKPLGDERAGDEAPPLPLKTFGRSANAMVRSAGTFGIRKTMQTREVSPRTSTAANAVRQSLRSPMNVPVGPPGRTRSPHRRR